MFKRLIYALIGIVFMMSCNKNPSQSSEGEKPEMYKTSELAQLMRQMYQDNDSIKAKLLRGEWPDSLPSYFASIHTAKATTPSDINATFKALADDYLHRFDSLKNASPAVRIDAYNHLVSGCISCHQVYCNGPIPKIQKLYIR
jgi:hypothetical protein